jgi:AcrR family transcriptional regulator
VSGVELLTESGGAGSPPQGSLKEDIVRVAIELGTELGEDGLTMRGIASRLGVSATALYQHFDGKSSILRAIRFHGLGKMNAAIAPAFELADPVEAIRDCMVRYIDFGRTSPWLYRVLFEGEDVDYTTLSDDERTAIGYSEEQTRRCCEAAKRDGKLRADVDVETAPYLLWAAAHGLATLMISGRISEKHPGFPVRDENEFVRNFVDLSVRGFMPC